MTKIFLTVVLFATLLVATLTSAQSVEPIWLSPTTIGQLPQVFPERGVWSNVSIGVGGRVPSPSWVFMDSKKTLWIMAGGAIGTNSNTVWNYDPKTDLYRWVAGFSDTQYHERVPGDLRVPSPDNWPSYFKDDLAGTIDYNDNIWFVPIEGLGELWMFNTTSFLFTRMFGLTEDGAEMNYGTPGQPSENVSPGVTRYGCFVTDSHNNLWQIGGVTANFNNRVWHFNTTSYLWTFITGNMSSDYFPTVYGDNPLFGPRARPSCDIDEEDRIWLFGGIGSTQPVLNDVWSFDTRTAQWRLEAEALGQMTNDSLYTTRPAVEVPDDFDPNNHPGGSHYPSFTDRKDGTLLLVPGDEAGVGDTNALWLFHKTLRQWKLVYGDPFNSNNTGNFSNYRTPGSVMPGRRGQGATRGLNLEGDVFVVGGGLNDVWLIPQQHCKQSTSNKCSSNAQCIEQAFGYSCQCNNGFTGDGFTCTSVPVAVPVIDESQTPSVSPSSSSQPSATTPHRKPHVSSGVMISSALLVVLANLVVLL